MQVGISRQLPMKRNTKTIIIYAAIFLAVILIATLLITRSSSNQITYSEILEKFHNNEVKESFYKPYKGNKTMKKRINENTKITLTIKQLRELVNEGTQEDSNPMTEKDVMDAVKACQGTRTIALELLFSKLGHSKHANFPVRELYRYLMKLVKNPDDELIAVRISPWDGPNATEPIYEFPEKDISPMYVHF